MVKEHDIVLPFCELGFDQCATPLNFSEPVRLLQVASLPYFTPIGRPLYVQHAHFVPRLLIFVDRDLLTDIYIYIRVFSRAKTCLFLNASL